MTDGLCALLPCNLYELLCNHRTRHRRTEKILILVDSIGLNTRHHIVLTEIIRDILDIKLRSTGKLRSLGKAIQLLALSDIHTAADDFIAEGLLQPGNDRCRIKTA